MFLSVFDIFKIGVGTLEHHLGMTCDPVKGLVQVPCIERNGLGAIKAVAAASLALRGDGTHVVPLDACIETMRQTGRDLKREVQRNLDRRSHRQPRGVLICRKPPSS